MRKIERIDVFLDILKKEWKKNPDQRFAQFLFNNGLENTGGLAYILESTELLNRMFPDIPKRDYVLWTSCGINGDEPPKTQLIKDLSTNHIKEIIKTEKQLSKRLVDLLKEEIVFRKTHNND